MIALGAVLIWLGLNSGGGTDDTVHAGSPDEVVEPVEGDLPDAAVSQPLMEREAETARLQAKQEQARRQREADEARRRREMDLARQRQAAAEAAERSRRDAARRDAERAAPDPRAELAANDDGALGFAGGGPGTQRVAELLIEAWLAGDPADLSAYLDQGEGADLPGAQRRMIAAFWQALGPQVDKARDTYDKIRGQSGVTSGQLGLLAAALDPPGRRGVPRPASSTRPEPLAHAMRMILTGDEARSLLEAREYARSAVAWSDLIKLEIAADWAPHRQALLGWAEELEQAQLNHRFSPRGEWPAVEVTVGNGETLSAIRKRVMRARKGFTICTGLIEAANGITGYIHPGDVLRVPTDPANVLVDLDARLVMYRHGEEVVRAWECGIGKPGHETPLGEYTIGVKQEKPAHTTRGLPYGHPDNPLGSHWLALLRDGKNTSYGIHGTSDPDGVGGEVSLGCIRMRNGDVAELFEILPQGAEAVLQR